ncbi:unnamed protein product [Pieris brassicae]|uniref:K Homology domain-containing protein n=1 Tax=Pieris brassicae TaxID=7116 RepID=A0A9P0XKZ6_PIEBR|nr:unnamed protein product [Pieris brassicae]
MSDLDSDCDDNKIPVQQNKAPPEQSFQPRGNNSARGQRDNQNFKKNSTTRGRGYIRGNNKVISIPSTKVGRVIGRGGFVIRHLEYMNKAKIKIGNSAADNTDITLYGTDAAIEKVEKMIQELTIDRKKEPVVNSSTVQAGSSA